jgi:beta-mannan synthase
MLNEALSVSILQGVSAWKKLHLLYSFFFVRRVVAPILTFLSTAL